MATRSPAPPARQSRPVRRPTGTGVPAPEHWQPRPHLPGASRPGEAARALSPCSADGRYRRAPAPKSPSAPTPCSYTRSEQYCPMASPVSASRVTSSRRAWNVASFARMASAQVILPVPNSSCAGAWSLSVTPGSTTARLRAAQGSIRSSDPPVGTGGLRATPNVAVSRSRDSLDVPPFPFRPIAHHVAARQSLCRRKHR